ncbi:MAG: penicillin-binding protein activator LpoB, partial [Planctomycetes bacterium GWA2_39_15]
VTTSKVTYEDPKGVETLTIDFGSTDLQLIAGKMVDSLLVSPSVVQVTSDHQPFIFVDKIKNKTLEHIDTESITDTIKTRLLNSGKFRFVDMTKVDTVRKQLEFQTESGLVDPSTAASIGKLIGAEYMLYGNFSSIVKRTQMHKDVYYKFTLNLMHLERGEIIWADEKEIRKTRERPLFGQ